MGEGIFRYIGPLFLISVFSFILSGSWYRAKVTHNIKRILGLLIISIVIMVSNALSSGTSLFIVLLDTAPFVLPFFSLVFVKDKYVHIIEKMFVVHTIIGVVLGIIILMNFSTHSLLYGYGARFIVKQSNLSAVKLLLYAAPYIYIKRSKFSKVLVFFSYSAMILMLIIGIVSQTRSVIGYLILTIMIDLYIQFKVGRIKNIYKSFILTSTLIIILIFSNWASQRGVTGSANALTNRFTGGGGSVIEQTLSDARINEAKYVFSNMSIIEYLFGSGVGSEWYSFGMFKETYRRTLHIGYAHLFWKGGLFLFLVYFYYPVWIGVKTMIKSSDLNSCAVSSMSVLYGFHLLYGGSPQIKFYFIAIYLFVGIIIRDDQLKFNN